MLAWGIIIDEQSYLRDGWNVLDFLVVVLSLIDLGVGGDLHLEPCLYDQVDAGVR